MSYAREKAGLAALKLREKGTLAERFEGASDDLTAISEGDIPKDLLAPFRQMKAAIHEQSGDREELASKLERLAEAVGWKPSLDTRS